MNELKRYQALVELARSLGRIMELNTLLDEILRRSQEVLEVEACSIFLPDRATGELVIHSALGDKAPMLFATKIPKGAGVAGAVFESGKTMTIRDAPKDPRHYAKVDEKTGFVTRSMITVPLLNGAEILGVLQVLNPVGRDFFDERDETICEAFSGLIVSALLRLEAQRHEVEEVKVQQEMELANEIQRSFLPASRTAFETCRARMLYAPARRIGGDFCFVHALEGGNRLLLGLGDVSGKGVPAALTMARVTATIKALAGTLGNDLGAWTTELNAQLVADLKAGRFIGLTLLLADADAERIHICAAGQYFPLRTDGQQWERLSGTAQLPLGVMPEFQYASQVYPLQRGDAWLLFSDGITEARNADDEEWGEDHFLKSLAVNTPAAAMFQGAVEAWKAFVGDASQHDDASLLFLDWRGKTPAAELRQMCEPATLNRARDFVETWAAFAGFDNVMTGQIVLACDEAMTNIYRHAYGGKPGPILLRAGIERDALMIQIEDEGRAIDPAKIKKKASSELKAGGLGTVLISKIFDNVEYAPQPKGTRLRLKKSVPQD